MQDEAEEPTIEIHRGKPSRAEILLVGAAWALLVFTLAAALQIWSGGSH
ncbi:MAG TPA: hypothetical protein VF548_17925 [Allosphingosinicella sp.]|jgi:hypothetical protein